MMHRQAHRITIGMVVALACATPAAALETGCQDGDAVRAALKSEGQYVVVSGLRPIPERPRNIFTTDRDGKIGYNIEEGKNNVLCVVVRFAEVQLNPNPDLATPAWAFRGKETAHDQWLARTQMNVDNRVMFGATVLRRDDQGNEVRGAFMMVTRGNGPGEGSDLTSGGAVTVTLSTGEIRPTIVLANIEKVQPNYDAFVQRNERTP